MGGILLKLPWEDRAQTPHCNLGGADILGAEACPTAPWGKSFSGFIAPVSLPGACENANVVRVLAAVVGRGAELQQLFGDFQAAHKSRDPMG